ncbi:hypothetical protein GCM10010365_20880 [Streptomyces poonensis]|uniref:Uncharacterized protein n=1 Tax=Streptomyces poonensis TaxID=68255 RepID=A0A918PEC7_9ACTN|nr:hypothetical protein GCM10010365_20880 [Streptomyces poonensis]GLJ93495.1 hypothetical protein GCM10017589_61090 [Streptomyces poonensis]
MSPARSTGPSPQSGAILQRQHPRVDIHRGIKRDYTYNGTLTVTAIVIWLRDTVQEPSETT